MSRYKNANIRIALIEADMAEYELAELLGIADTSLSRKLRRELPEKEQQDIIAKIREYKK